MIAFLSLLLAADPSSENWDRYMERVSHERTVSVLAIEDQISDAKRKQSMAAKAEIAGLFEVAGTKKYANQNDSTSTVFYLRSVEIPKKD